jgi:NTE family protein
MSRKDRRMLDTLISTVGKERSQPETVFVLAGGGNLGAVQVGMLYALLEAGISPDAIVGTSIGALNGAFLAGHPGLRGVDELAQLWSTVHRPDVFPVRVRELLRGVIGHRKHLFDSIGLRTLLQRADLGFEDLEEAPTPLSVVATDLHTGEAVILSAGNAVSALLASAAIPGVFPPVEIDGRTLVDGGVVANTPIAQAERYDPSLVIVLPTVPNTLDETPGNAVAMMQRAMTLAGRNTEQLIFGEVSSRRKVEWLPAPAEAGHLSIFDFSATDRLIDESYRLSSGWLAQRKPDLRPSVVTAARTAPHSKQPVLQGAVA